RIPAIYATRPWTRSGGLMAYAVDTVDLMRRAAGYVDRLLKGANPAELPVQQPSKYEFSINLKTAKALGLDISTNLLALADEVIESQVGWTTQPPWSAGTIDQRRFDGLRLLRQVPAITELAQLDSAGKEQLKVSRLAMDVVASQGDMSSEPKFAEAVAKKVYYGPVYFRRESEPYMMLALAGTRRDAGVSVAEVNLKLIWDVITAIK